MLAAVLAAVLAAGASTLGAQQPAVRFEAVASMSFERFADLGTVTDAVGDDGRIVVLDGRNHRIVVADDQLRPLSTFGTRGAGAGQFLGPMALARLGPGRIAVLDRTLRRVSILTIGQQGRAVAHERTIPLDVRATAFCALGGDTLLVYAPENGFRLHAVASDGRMLRSLAPVDRSLSRMAQTIVAQGRLACDPRGDVVLLSSDYRPYVEAFRLSDGRPAWTDTLSPFRPPQVTDRDTSVTVSSGHSGFSLITTLLGTPAYRVYQTMFDSRQDGATVDTVTTYVHAAQAKRWLPVTLDMPRLIALGGARVLAIQAGTPGGIAVGHLLVTQRSASAASGRMLAP